MFETYKGAQSAKKNTFSAFGGHSATRAKNLTSASGGEDGTPASTFLVPGCIFGDREAPRGARTRAVSSAKPQAGRNFPNSFFKR